MLEIWVRLSFIVKDSNFRKDGARLYFATSDAVERVLAKRRVKNT